MSTRDVLIQALDLLDKGWCQGHDAELETIVVTSQSAGKGRAACDPRDERAVAWCAQGAVIRAVWDLCTGRQRLEFAGEPLTEARRILHFIDDYIDEGWASQPGNEVKMSKCLGFCPVCQKAVDKGPSRSVVRFNDDDHTTVEDVKLMFKRALTALDG